MNFLHRHELKPISIDRKQIFIPVWEFLFDLSVLDDIIHLR